MARIFRTYVIRQQQSTMWWIILYNNAPAAVYIALQMLMGMGQ